jgi:hypothetical protein
MKLNKALFEFIIEFIAIDNHEKWLDTAKICKRLSSTKISEKKEHT